ncbi:MAG TPA: hypothetical protein VII29_14570, partial [Terriglobales bacterium]
KLGRIFAMLLQLDEVLEAGRDGVGDCFLALDRGKMPKNDARVALNDGIEWQEIVVPRNRRIPLGRLAGVDLPTD